MLCGPKASEVTVKVATPEAIVVPVPSVAAPSRNVTVSPDAAVPLPGADAVTVAVNVTDWLTTKEAAEEVSAVAELAWFTVCEIAVEMLDP